MLFLQFRPSLQGLQREAVMSSEVALVHAHEQLQPQSNARVPAQRKDPDPLRHDGRPQQVLHGGGPVRVPIEHPVIACLVFVVNPVEGVICAVLDAVLRDPLVCVTPALSENPRHDRHLFQVDLKPLVLVIKL